MADSLIDDNQNDTTDRAELEAKWKDKTPAEVLSAKVESDLYIKTLTSRLDDLRKDYLALREESTAKASLEELIARQEKLLANPETPPPTPRDDVNQPSFKPEEIDALLEQKLTAREQLNKQTENFNFIKAKLREQFGDNAGSTLIQRIDTLGLGSYRNSCLVDCTLCSLSKASLTSLMAILLTFPRSVKLKLLISMKIWQ